MPGGSARAIDESMEELGRRERARRGRTRRRVARRDRVGGRSRGRARAGQIRRRVARTRAKVAARVAADAVAEGPPPPGRAAAAAREEGGRRRERNRRGRSERRTGGERRTTMSPPTARAPAGAAPIGFARAPRAAAAPATLAMRRSIARSVRGSLRAPREGGCARRNTLATDRGVITQDRERALQSARPRDALFRRQRRRRRLTSDARARA